MVERGIEPFGRLVTVTTLSAAAAFMYVVALVAVIASRRSVEESMVGVTIETGGQLVLADEAEPGRVMIE